MNLQECFRIHLSEKHFTVLESKKDLLNKQDVSVEE